MKIKSLKIKNILSIEEAYVEFGDSGLVLVEGFDYDTGRANGAGKSAIFNAISFALYDKVPRKITKSEILRKNTKSGFAEICVLTSAGRYTIKRSRPAAVEIYSGTNKVDMSQQELESKLGLSYEQFLTTMYNAQDSQDRFVFLNDRGKKEFLLKIMNLGNFNLYKKNISDSLSKLEQESEIIKTKIQGHKNSIDIYKSQIADPETIKASIDQLDKDIDSYTSEIKLLAAVSQPDTQSVKDMVDKIEEKLAEIRTARIMCTQRRAELEKLNNISADDTCPDCGVEINIVNGKLHKHTNTQAVEDQKQFLAKEINELEDIMFKETEYSSMKSKLYSKIQDQNQEFNEAQSQIREYSRSIEFKQSEKLQLESQIQKNQEIKDKVTDIVTQVKTLNARQLEIKSDSEVLETVSQFFDPTGAPAYIMDSVVDSFNDSVTDYINHIWPNASYSLQTYKQNKDKSISSKFSESLMINGKSTSIGSLSGGELRALSLAVDFAIVDILSGKFSLDLNPIILDEPFNGLDSAGKEMVIELLEKLANEKEIWVVDHASEAKSLFSRTIRVEKRNAISKLLDQ